MSRNLLFTIVVAALSVATTSMAQPPRNPPPNRPAEAEAPAAATSGKYLAIPGLYPLAMTSVQREIGLTADQKQQLKAVADGYVASMRQLSTTFSQLKPEERQQQSDGFREKQEQAAESAQRKAEAILTPQQLQAIHAVEFQFMATNALADPNLQTKIRLSAEQRERLTKVFDEAAEKMQQLQRQTAQQTMQVLDEQQTAALKQQLEAQPKQ